MFDRALEVAKSLGLASTKADLDALAPADREAVERLAATIAGRAEARETVRPAGSENENENDGRRDPEATLRKAPAGRLGPYLLLAELGRGGMGVVYRAHDPRLDRECAIKVLSTEDAPPAHVERFAREGRSAARLDRHPNIVPVYELGESAEGRPYIVMAFVRGTTLARALDRGPLPPRRAAEVVRAVALALGHAHGHGLVHRDVKPSNVLLDERGEPLLSDFGLALDLGSAERLSVAGALIGTPAYMAPEQAHGRADLDARADVYSAGAVLYHCLCGRPPHEGPTLAATVARVLQDDPLAPRRLVRAIPRDLETIVLKAIDKEPARRYESAGALAEDLRRFLAGEPILGSRAGPLLRAWKLVRRRPRESAALAVAVVGLAFGAAYQVRNARRGEAIAHLAAGAAAPTLETQIAHAGAAIHTDPAFARAWVARGVAVGRLGRVSSGAERRRLGHAAIHDYERALAIEEDARVRFLLAEAHRDLLGDHEAALREFARALEAAGANTPTGLAAAAETSAQLGRVEEALARVTQALALAPDWAELHVLRGSLYHDLGRNNEAIADLDRAVALDPRSPAALALGAYARLLVGRTREALDHIGRAVELVPDRPMPYLIRAAIHRRLGERARMLADARRAVDLAPDNADARLELANAYVELARLKEAETEVEWVEVNAKLGRRQSGAAHVRALILAGRGRTAEALAALERGFPGEDASNETRFLRSALRIELGDLAGAADDISEILRRDPRDPLAYARRSHIKAALMDLPGAKADFVRSLELAPENPDVRGDYAHFLRQIGDRAGAKREIDAAIKLSAERPDEIYLRGLWAAEDGDEASARRDLEAAATRDPEWGRPPLALAKLAAARGDPEGARTLARRAALVAREPAREDEIAEIGPAGRPGRE